MSPPVRALLILTFVTGILDAVAFLALGQVFAAMQTGNVIFLGLGLSGSAGTAVGAPLIALAGFLLGGGLAALAAAHPAAGQNGGIGLAVTLEVALLALAAVIAAVAEPAAREPAAYVLIGLLSLTMGLRNTLVRGVAGANILTTVLNLTLTGPAGLAAGSELGERAAGFLAILLGALVGGLLLRIDLVAPLVAAGALALAAGLTHTRARPAANRAAA
jgi:uncharacterized membrane protein YoaK (UPF0700 family)